MKALYHREGFLQNCLLKKNVFRNPTNKTESLTWNGKQDSPVVRTRRVPYTRNPTAMLTNSSTDLHDKKNIIKGVIKEKEKNKID